MEIIVVWRKRGYVWMCVVKELCWVSVQGCAQDCYIKEGITDLPRFRCRTLKYFL